MKILPGNAQNIGRRQDQQDEFWFSDIGDTAFVSHGGVLAIVADGMGGLEKGGEASRLAARTFGQSYLGKAPAQPIPEALQIALERANLAVCKLSKSVDDFSNVGTTLVAAAIARDGLHWIAVGDSRLYLFRRGELTRFTTDHNYSEVLRGKVGQGQLSLAEAERDPDWNSLTSYLGMAKFEEVDRNLRPFPLEAGDWILLCSDGLHGILGDREIAGELHGNPQDAADRLIQRVLALNHPRQDNVTIAIMSYEPSGTAAGGGRNPKGWPFFGQRPGILIGTAALAVALLGAFAYWDWNRPSPSGETAAAEKKALPLPANSSRHAAPPASSGTDASPELPETPSDDSGKTMDSETEAGRKEIETLMETARQRKKENHLSKSGGALETYEKVLELDPNYSPAQKGIDVIRAELRQREAEARDKGDIAKAKEYAEGAQRAEAALSRNAKIIKEQEAKSKTRKPQPTDSDAGEKAETSQPSEPEGSPAGKGKAVPATRPGG